MPWLFPAHAGMILDKASAEAARDTIPRTRGDDPTDGDAVPSGLAYSPHTRG